MDAAARIFIGFSTRKLQLLMGRIESCLDLLTEDRVWARGGENENAIGNLALHLAGNVRQWIISGVGGVPDIRRRDTEFDARGGVSIPALKLGLRSTVEEAIAVIESVSPARLPERLVIQGYDASVLEAIFHVVEHFSMHTGQIVFATKLLTGADLGFYSHLRTTAAHAQKTP